MQAQAETQAHMYSPPQGAWQALRRPQWEPALYVRAAALPRWLLAPGTAQEGQHTQSASLACVCMRTHQQHCGT
jgi:hypothetical protein